MLIGKMLQGTEVLGARDEIAKERCMEVYKEENEKVKMCINQSKNHANNLFGKRMNLKVGGNRKLFWMEVGKVNVEMWKVAVEWKFETSSGR